MEFDEQRSVLLGVRHAKLSVDNVGALPNETTKTLPTAALMFKPWTGALLYANLARGLEPGGSSNPTGNSTFLPPRLTKQVECGAKLERNDMLYTAALFDMRRPLEITISPTETVQQGTQRHRGIELIANGRITPALTVVSGLMWLDSACIVRIGRPGPFR